MKKEYCEHCGASLKEYWHRVTPLLVKTLIKFRASVNDKGRNSIHVSEEVKLTKTEYNNFQKLRFHALIAKVNEDGERKTGYWLLTHRGAEFLNGRQMIPFRVKTYRNRVIDHDSRFVLVKDIIGTTPFLETRVDFDYDIHEEVEVNIEKHEFKFDEEKQVYVQI